MIYTSSYFGLVKGRAVPISLSTPNVQYPLADTLTFFCPTPVMLKYWKYAEKTGRKDEVWERYKSDYIHLIKSRWSSIEPWLGALDPEVDMTLLCWEKSNKYCHRQFVDRLVEYRRSDCWGGELVA